MPFIAEPERHVDWSKLARWKPVPKVAAALVAAAVLVAIVALAGLVDIDLTEPAGDALVVVVAAVAPAVAAYLKADRGGDDQ